MTQAPIDDFPRPCCRQGRFPKTRTWIRSVWVVPLVVVLWLSCCVPTILGQSLPNGDDSLDRQDASNNNNNNNKREPKKLITLAESITKTTNSLKDPTAEDIRKQYWQKTLADIRNMSFGFTSSSTPATARSGSSRSIGQESDLPANETASTTTTMDEPSFWRSASNLTFFSGKPRRRFEGFMSWDRMLQEWAEDIQEYMDQVERETNGADYAFGNFGRSSNTKVETAVEEAKDEASNEQQQEQEVVNETLDASVSLMENATSEVVREEEMAESEAAASSTKQSTTRKPILPVPAPAQPGEAVLPHTDISDLSKRIEIVTTASLPWRTGTAVNPLLRAAYLTHGRAAAGGSVTLMLPWLERRSDQEKIYGADQTFESPEEQEAYIRDWLKNAASMPEAATDLRIRWYTAWQNPVENSIYSMGDITALIPPDEVDICILEEPEHLNWYRAPGESWTKRFKHVVGVLHTSE